MWRRAVDRVAAHAFMWALVRARQITPDPPAPSIRRGFLMPRRHR